MTSLQASLKSNAHWLTMLLVVVALGLGSSACVAHSKYMKEVALPLEEIVPSASTARVVFVRPSAMGSAVKFMIIDQNGRFLGEATASSHFAVDLAPGEYLFIAEGENTAVMHANLAANHVYYAEVLAKMGLLIARVALEPIKPGTDAWQALPELLTDTQRYAPLLEAGQASLAENPNTIAKRIANAKSNWADLSADERAELSLEPNDGVAGPTAASAPVAPPPAAAAPSAVAPPVDVPSAPPVPGTPDGSPSSALAPANAAAPAGV